MPQSWLYKLPDGTAVALAVYDGPRAGCGTCLRLAEYRLAVEEHTPALKCASCAQSYLHRTEAQFTDSTVPGDTPDQCPDHGPHNEEYCPGCKRDEHRRAALAAGVTPGY